MSRTSTISEFVQRRIRQRPVRIDDLLRFVLVFAEVQFQTVAIFGRISAIRASVLIMIRMRFHVRIQHRFVDASVIALLAFERFRLEMIPQVIFQMVFVFGDKFAFWASQLFFRFYVTGHVVPKCVFVLRPIFALFAFERFWPKISKFFYSFGISLHFF